MNNDKINKLEFCVGDPLVDFLGAHAGKFTVETARKIIKSFPNDALDLQFRNRESMDDVEFVKFRRGDCLASFLSEYGEKFDILEFKNIIYDYFAGKEDWMPVVDE